MGAKVVNPEGNLVALHAGHGVLHRLYPCNALRYVHQGVVGYHCLVHAVVGQVAAAGRPENAFVDSELIPMNSLSVNNARVIVGCNGNRSTLSISNVEVVCNCVGKAGIVRA